MNTRSVASMMIVVCAMAQLACSGGTATLADGFIIHTGLPETSTTASRVFLGDGTVFSAKADDHGDVIFRDNRLTLPQDVTWVQTTADSPNTALVMTIVGVDAAELWFKDVSDSQAPTVEASVSGDVTPHGAGINVVGAGGDFWATSGLYANGYVLNLRGTAEHSVDVVAYQYGAGAPYGNFVSVGVARDVAVVRNHDTKQDIALDHPATPFVVTAANDSAYGGAEGATFDFSFASLPVSPAQVVFSSAASGAFPLSVGTPVMDGPLDALRRTLKVYATRAADGRYMSGIDPAKFNGTCVTESVDASTTSADVTFLTPAQVTSPALGKLSAPGTAPADHPTFAWTQDPDVTLTRLTLSSGGAYNTNPRWTVYLPSSHSTFTFPSFVAPNGIVVLNTSTTYQVELESYSYGGVSSATDLWTNPKGPGRVTFGDTRDSYQTGFLTLQ